MALTEGFLQPFWQLRIRVTKLWEPLCKDFPRTGALFAEEAAHLDDKGDWATTGWQVMQHPDVSALHAFGDCSTTRACSSGRCCTHRERNFFGNMNVFNTYIGNIRNNEHGMLMAPQPREHLWKICLIFYSTTSYMSSVRGSVGLELRQILSNLLAYHIFYQQSCVRVILLGNRHPPTSMGRLLCADSIKCPKCTKVVS